MWTEAVSGKKKLRIRVDEALDLCETCPAEFKLRVEIDKKYISSSIEALKAKPYTRFIFGRLALIIWFRTF